MLTRLIESTVVASKLLEINFKRAWWYIFTQQWLISAIVLLFNIIDLASFTLLPIVIGYILTEQNGLLIIGVVGYYITLELIGWFLYHPAVNQLYAQTQSSFKYSAYRHLLGVDPINHVHRASGIVIGKIQRTAVAYSDFIHALLDDVVQFVVEMGTVIVSALLFNYYLGIVIGIFIIGLTIPFCYIMLRKTDRIENEMNSSDDKANQVGTESLAQVQFIRASFMSNRIRDALHRSLVLVTHTTVRLWMTYALLRGIFIMIYMISLGIVLGVMVNLIKSDALTPLYATTIVAMYLRAARKMFKLDQIVKTMVSSYRRIKDFYSFVHNFGEQTFPVFNDDVCDTVNTIPAITHIRLQDVSFRYSEQRIIFDSISCDIRIPRSDTNKLYGIIGPSGVGKTTFLSIIGGQLKPSAGVVMIDNYDIYTLDDDGRKRLLALQGQIATNVRGTLRYNLLFGLPENRHYQDAQLVSLLRSVGLWHIFEYEFGLETLIGEGGLSLSGGQRQRLNFANLYLRAQYYKPSLILIDEPTSSLDELSEAAITKMIAHLAEKCITFVIAHRLKTLEDACRILDFSVIDRDKNLVFYTRDQLQRESEYYQQLITGVRDIGE